jgi:hypothetical protein
MTSKWAKEYIDELKEDTKIQILHVAKGGAAVNHMKEILFPYDEEEGNKWSSQFTADKKRTAQLIVYSHMKRTKKTIIFKLLIGTKEEGSLVGEQVTYEKGMKLMGSLNMKV